MDTNTKLLIEKRNAALFLRPRFSIDLKTNSQSLLQLFTETFKAKKTTCRAVIVEQHIFISVPKKDEHFWSPQLHLEIIEKDKNSTEIRGLFGPKPQVWTLFMFVHFAVGVFFLVFLAMLYTKVTLKESYIFPLLMVIFLPLVWVILYFLGKLGKDIGKPQIKQLHDVMIQIITHQV